MDGGLNTESASILDDGGFGWTGACVMRGGGAGLQPDALTASVMASSAALSLVTSSAGLHPDRR